MKGIRCLILAGGLATRLRPVTETIPKALVEVAGKPFLDHQLACFAANGVTDVVLSVGYLGEQIRGFAGDGSRWGLRAQVVEEGKDLRGTAGAIRLALDQGALADEFAVAYGDSYMPIDFKTVRDSFLASGKPALMVVLRNEGKWERSNCEVQGSQVVLYDKTPGAAGSEKFHHTDYGISFWKADEFRARVPAGVKMDLAGVFHDLSREGKLAAYEAPSRFYEMGSPEGLEELRKLLEKENR